MAEQQTPEELQKQIETVTKQRELAKVQKELLDAQNALAAAQRDPAAQMSEQVAAANAAAALANAKKAQSEAENAAFKAAIGEVPASGITGSVTTSAGAGEIEATLLTAKAVRNAVSTIEPKVRSGVVTNTSIVVMAVSDIPTFQNHIAYKAQLGIVQLALNNAITASQGAPPPTVAAEAAVPFLGGAGLVLDATSKLLSFFRTDYTVAGVTVEASDLVALTELANLLAVTKDNKTYKVIAPALFNGKAMVDAGGFLVADITTLASLRQTADTLAKRHDSEVDELTKSAESEKDPAKKQVLQNDAARRKGLAGGLRGAMQLFDMWFTKLTTPDDKGVVGLVTVARERAIVDQLNGGGKLLAVKVQKAGGAFMTKKNLWTFFGAMPIYHMGGVSVSYALMDGTTGQIATSGVVPVYGGFVKAGQLTNELGK